MILGTWKRIANNSDQTWEFRQNKTLQIGETNLIVYYWFQNNSLVTYFPGIEMTDTYSYQFNGKNDLTLTMIASSEMRIDPITGEIIPFEPMEIKFQRVNQ